MPVLQCNHKSPGSSLPWPTNQRLFVTHYHNDISTIETEFVTTTSQSQRLGDRQLLPYCTRTRCASPRHGKPSAAYKRGTFKYSRLPPHQITKRCTSQMHSCPGFAPRHIHWRKGSPPYSAPKRSGSFVWGHGIRVLSATIVMLLPPKRPLNPQPVRQGCAHNHACR
ncbi:hypothetical protein P280DRAFT_119218 [Massarina eburnea CBS 473.64]|uniref:Uncharacterized protein n=1 Tax=Massarina eburnea CBS 473.64 TaxID=1395130 RepID=A0A6A6SEU2_9PLEO|nr:hypothetical protein P280DRAFT_119218 [Massarina eburnea CBS 473.64]